MDKFEPPSPKLAIQDRRIDNSLRIEAWDLDNILQEQVDLLNKRPK